MKTPNEPLNSAKNELQLERPSVRDIGLALLLLLLVAGILAPAIGFHPNFRALSGVPAIVCWQAFGSMLLGLLCVVAYRIIFQPWAALQDEMEKINR